MGAIFNLRPQLKIGRICLGNSKMAGTSEVIANEKYKARDIIGRAVLRDGVSGCPKWNKEEVLWFRNLMNLDLGGNIIRKMLQQLRILTEKFTGQKARKIEVVTLLNSTFQTSLSPRGCSLKWNIFKVKIIYHPTYYSMNKEDSCIMLSCWFCTSLILIVSSHSSSVFLNLDTTDILDQTLWGAILCIFLLTPLWPFSLSQILHGWNR